jgi:SpoVK/Ycf46/Vps4 family AAA+-type ATPase
MDSVGGMKNLKNWIAKRKKAWTPEAKEFGLPVPKGLLFVGIPGSGKSLLVQVIAETLNIPLVRLDMGKIHGSLVGQSEANMRMAIQVAEAVSPCILWIDEIEKGLAGSTGQSLDSGVGSRILGTMLTWMQEKTSEVFVCSTANDVTSLPPELLRKGRFDEMFSVLLPNQDERKEIFAIHLKKRNRGKLIGKVLDLDFFAKRTEGYSGAEIEATIVDSMYTAFDAGEDIDQQNLVDAIDNLQPLSKTMAEKINRMEEWCKGRARPANGDESLASPVNIPGGRMVDA